MSFFSDAKKQVFDIAVVGGGAAGVMAALSAAGKGAKVALIEAGNCLGGIRTKTGVDTFYGFYSRKEPQNRVVGGISWKTVEALQKENACFERQNSYGAGMGITYDVEVLKYIWDDMVVKTGIYLLFHTQMCHVKREAKMIESIVIANKSGLSEIAADYYIDATGDGDLAAFAGAETIPLEERETLQSLTNIFFMGNVDLEKSGNTPQRILEEKMKASKDYGLTRLDGSFHKTPHPGVIQANMARVTSIDATVPEQLTQAEIEGRRQIYRYVRFLKENVEGFENAFLISTSQYIGVRETRRILGEYILTEDDVVYGKKFEDGIALCGAPVEEHHAGADTKWVYVGGDGTYSIPYRCLVVKSIDNLAVAGRCASMTHIAQASARNTAQVMAMGEAAGLAAAQCLENGKALRDASVCKLITALKEQNAIL